MVVVDEFLVVFSPSGTWKGELIFQIAGFFTVFVGKIEQNAPSNGWSDGSSKGEMPPEDSFLDLLEDFLRLKVLRLGQRVQMDFDNGLGGRTHVEMDDGILVTFFPQVQFGRTGFLGKEGLGGVTDWATVRSDFGVAVDLRSGGDGADFNFRFDAFEAHVDFGCVTGNRADDSLVCPECVFDVPIGFDFDFIGVVDGEGAGRLANDISAFTGKISPFRVGLHIDETFALLRLLGCLVGAFCFLNPFDEAVFGKKFARRILCRNCETFGALGFV